MLREKKCNSINEFIYFLKPRITYFYGSKDIGQIIKKSNCRSLNYREGFIRIYYGISKGSD